MATLEMASDVEAEVKSSSQIEQIETQEWLDSLDFVLDSGGPDRVAELLKQLEIHAQRNGVKIPFAATTPYINSIPHGAEPKYPGDREIERRLKSIIRWNAMAMVVRAQKIKDPDGKTIDVGGHISTYASSATLLEVGFNHFFKAPHGENSGDQIFFQGHGFARPLCPRFCRRTTERKATHQFPSGTAARRWPFVLSASVADARFLAVPHGFDGTWPDSFHLSGAF